MGNVNSVEDYDQSIDVSIGAEVLRDRPAQFLGSEKLAGARHTFTEIYGNALDEKSAGFGDKIIIHYYKDGSVSVRDFGRGVPMGWNDKPKVKNWNWHVIYNALHGGGKGTGKDAENQQKLREMTDWSNFDERQFNYIFSVGLNGVGAAATQFTSEFCEVKSYRDGVCTYRNFEKGIPIIDGVPKKIETMTPEEIKAIPELKEPTDEPDGTFVHWKPDIEVFSEVEFGSDWLLGVCKDISDVAGVDLIFIDDNTDTNITFKAGTLKDLVLKKSEGVRESDNIIFNEVLEHGSTTVKNMPFVWVCKCQVAIARVNKALEYNAYHNSVKMINGMHFDAINDAIYDFLRTKASARGVRIEGRDCEGIFAVAVSTYSNHASFRNQTKDGVEDGFIYSTVKSAITSKLDIEFAKGNKDIISAVEKVVKEAELRIQMKAVEKLKREANSVKREKEPDKFVSCDAYEKKRYEEAELWITEGDSAKSSVKEARNKVFQAIYPIRGKGINVAKKSLDKVLANKEIKELFALLGTGYDLNIKGYNDFDMDKLRFGKIIFATDADEDGYQIRVLLFLTLYHLAPRLITEGHVFIAETPRFRINFTNGLHVYAKNDAERDRIIAENPGKISRISRFKGLGEVNADVLRETTVHPDTRNLVPVTCDLLNNTERDLIDALFGADKMSQRKAIITTVLGAEVANMMEENALLLGEIDDDDEIEEGIDYVEV